MFDGGFGLTDSPRAFLTGSVGPNGSSDPASSGTNLFDYLVIPNSIIDHWNSPRYGYSDLPPFPSDMTGRNAFRSPGFWSLDIGIYKTFSVSERVKLQFRGEAYNIMNHANLYVIGSSADVQNAVTGAGATAVNACRGCTTATADRRNLQLAVKLIF